MISKLILLELSKFYIHYDLKYIPAQTTGCLCWARIVFLQQSTRGWRGGYQGRRISSWRRGVGSNLLWGMRWMGRYLRILKLISPCVRTQWRSTYLFTPFWTYAWILRGEQDCVHQQGGGIRRASYSQGVLWRRGVGAIKYTSINNFKIRITYNIFQLDKQLQLRLKWLCTIK